MRISKVFKKLIYTIPVLWVVSCSAPHDNPLDPESENYKAPDSLPPVVVIPTFTTSLHSVHTGRTTIDIFQVLAELAPDSNFAIDSVTVQYKSLAPRRMYYSTTTATWGATLTSSFFQDDHLESVVGQRFCFFVYAPGDTAAQTWQVGPAYLFRVIQEVPEISDPDSNEVVGPFPTLSWPAFDVLYPVRYQSVVEYSEGSPFPIIYFVWSSDTLPASTTAVQVADSLEDRSTYQWKLYVYDSFGNTSISLESKFQVQAGVVQ